jgi:cobalt/nickel transport system permease protein
VHIPDGFLDVKTATAAGVLAAVGVGVALTMTRRRHGERTAPLMGVACAFIFAAQMVNFPIPGGSSGHLLGGTLAAAVLGPWAGILVISVVLLVQALLFQDGGVTALGANIVNMGLIGAGLSYVIYAAIRRLIGGMRGVVAGAVPAAWFSVVLSALACSAELAAGGDFALPTVLNVMLLAHVYIGVGEAAVTGLVLAAIIKSRPDLIHRADGVEPVGDPASEALPAARLGHGVQIVVAGLCAALAVAVFLSPLASEAPDGLDAAAAKLDMAEPKPVWTHSPMPDYGKDIWPVTSIAGAIGTLVVFVLAFVLARGLAGRKSTHAATTV